MSWFALPWPSSCSAEPTSRRSRLSGRELAATRVGVFKGKYVYMSPEQVSGTELDDRSDLFAVGLLLHELLTGKPVYDSARLDVVLELARRARIERPSRSRSEVTPALDTIVMRSLARRREDRWRSAGEMQGALAQLLSTACPSFTPKMAARWLAELSSGHERSDARRGSQRRGVAEYEDIDPLTASARSSTPSLRGGRGVNLLNASAAQDVASRAREERRGPKQKPRRVPVIVMLEEDGGEEPAPDQFDKETQLGNLCDPYAPTAPGDLSTEEPIAFLESSDIVFVPDTNENPALGPRQPGYARLIGSLCRGGSGRWVLLGACVAAAATFLVLLLTLGR